MKAPRRPVEERVRDWREVEQPLPTDALQKQAARCMDCGIPFCHQGCPLGNVMPDFNDLVYRNRWDEAIERLHATNNFPEFTGRLCPAPCEASCVLGATADPVTIKYIEHAIIERAWQEGWVRPQPPAIETGKRVAIIGSGPAGLACAQQLRRAGHQVTLFERADRIGGLLRYGIPQFKLEKHVLDRRLAQLEAEGVEFRPGVNVGVECDAAALRREYDAIVLAGGATHARDLNIPGRQLKGIYQAMHFLPMANRFAIGDVVNEAGDILVKPVPPYEGDGQPVALLSARGRKVVIIGGGDTGADCLGTALRQQCESVAQFEIVPKPPETRAPQNPWPQWSNIFRVSSAHEEGGIREYQISTQEFLGDAEGNVCALRTVRVEMQMQAGRPTFVEIPGTEEIWEADLVLLAMGFLGPEKGAVMEQLGVEFDERGNVKSDEYRQTNVEGVFTAGDMARGQSLIVWAIAEGRHCAHGVDRYLMGESALPRPLAHGQDKRPFT